jgi:chloride channel protein, CIC family
MPQAAPQPNTGRLGDFRKFSAKFWLLTAITGIGAGLGGGLLMKLLFTMQRVAWPAAPGDFQDYVRKATPWHHIAVMFAAGLFAGVARRLIRFAPGGHGGEVSHAIWFDAGKFPALRTFSKAVVSIIIVGMGAAVGREGALKQTGAAIASKLSEWFTLPPAQRRLLAACGAGAGMAAAYNVPFGGALFALEVLLGTLSLPLVIPALVCSLIATAVSWIFLPTEPSYTTPPYILSVTQIGWAIVAGPIFGIASAFYIRWIGWADRQKPKRLWMILAPVVVFTALGLAAVPFPELLGNGKNVVQRALDDRFPLHLLAILIVLRPLATGSCLASGAPGGLFTPTMTIGALLGASLGHVWRMFAGGGLPGTYALLGAGSMLAAATQGPVSSLVLVMELTRHADAAMVPLLLSAAMATATSRRFEKKSIYSARVQDDEAAAFERHHGPHASDYMVLPASATYSRVVRRLLESIRRSVPLFVVDAEGKPVGEITLNSAQNAEASAVPIDTTSAGDLGTNTPAVERLNR